MKAAAQLIATEQRQFIAGEYRKLFATFSIQLSNDEQRIENSIETVSREERDGSRGGRKPTVARQLIEAYLDLNHGWFGNRSKSLVVDEVLTWFGRFHPTLVAPRKGVVRSWYTQLCTSQNSNKPE